MGRDNVGGDLLGAREWEKVRGNLPKGLGKTGSGEEK